MATSPTPASEAAQLLPPNATALERAVVQVFAEELACIPQPHRDLWNPSTCPVALLPLLAWSLGAETWDENWPVSIKRSVTSSALTTNRFKGRASAVRGIVRAFGGAITIVEWWQKTPKGVPHTFEIILSVGTEDAEDAAARYAQLIREVKRLKPLRSHFTATQALSARGTAHLAAVGRPATFRRLSLTVDATASSPPA
ncbi:tail protein [Hylemonella gracilis str. Niagara R]|uniref:Tail protein n=1 Tax=Hylemonella gracilis str. Niagara R TaxID=1458275 RepID=A0A016XH76_9BURK|nr:phage tail protein I [Hylemonella gracilis]EYC51449.1 tail protein [Hylemonella gracilis str. Niagara R]